jgi:hypothetical protein
MSVRERQGSKYGEPASDGKRYAIFIEIVSSLVGITALIKVVASERYDPRQGIRSRHTDAREIVYASLLSPNGTTIFEQFIAAILDEERRGPDRRGRISETRGSPLAEHKSNVIHFAYGIHDALIGGKSEGQQR